MTDAARRALLATALLVATIAFAAPAAAQPVNACDVTVAPDGVHDSVERNINQLNDRHPTVGPSVPSDMPASVERTVRALHERSGCA